MLKNLSLTACLVICSMARATPPENALSATSQSRLKAVVRKSIDDKGISDTQRQRTLYWIQASPCTDVERTPSQEQKDKISLAIGKQFDLERADIGDYFRYGGWYIVSADVMAGDTPWLVYSQNPVTAQKPVTFWAGAPSIFETDEVDQWLREQAPGIPEKLSQCFAWSMTLARADVGRSIEAIRTS